MFQNIYSRSHLLPVKNAAKLKKMTPPYTQRFGILRKPYPAAAEDNNLSAGRGK